MKIKAIINLMCATESGVSKATGNPWKSKECVLEINDGNEYKSTIAARTMNTDVIAKMEKAQEGDEVTCEVRFFARAREFARKDGTSGIIRNVECNLMAFEITKESGF